MSLSQPGWTNVAVLCFVVFCAAKVARAAELMLPVKDKAEKMMDEKEKKGGRRSLVSLALVA